MLNKLLAWWPGSKASFTSRHRGSLSEFSFTALEDRRMLAADISFDGGTGIVTVRGGNGNDLVEVTHVSPGFVGIYVAQTLERTYDVSTVNQIKVFGGAGDDVFTNSTDIDGFFNGHLGNDVFYGGSGNDIVYAGAGNDELHGGDGDDYLFGDLGVDTLYGDAGEDELHGWLGADFLYGGDGDDYLAGEFQNDTIYGEGGNDLLLGSTGDDYLSGGDGDDYNYGQGGNDIVYGNAGRDRVRGNNGDDILYGGEGNDFMMSDYGNDRAYGEAGDDTIFASDGVDELYGGDGDDGLYGEAGTNVLIGGNGNDTIKGGTGDDLIRAEAGDDWVHAGTGNDTIFGGEGTDRILGGSGDDVIHGGGLGAADSLVGNEGSDRFLRQANDYIQDPTAEDAVLEFHDRSSQWSDLEIEVLEGGFAKLFEATGNNALLRDSVDSGNLKFFKEASLGGAAGINSLSYSTSTQWINGQRVTTTTYEREIQILEWDETSDWYNEQFASVAIHELGHNWDDDFELEAASELLVGVWDEFLAISGWTETNPNDPGNFTQSGDGQWWYSNSAAFAEDYGRSSPYEDLATIWEYAFGVDSEEYDPALLTKINLYTSVFDVLS